jgi:proteasome lid subunit RPN8/RPN11
VLPLVVTVPKDQLELMIDDARGRFPVEACGLLAGKGQTVKRVYPLANVEESPVRFAMDRDVQAKAFREIEGKGWEVVGVYHSHPVGPSGPSAEDLKGGTFPDYLYVIVDLKEFSSPRCSAYRIRQGEVAEVSLEIVD